MLTSSPWRIAIVCHDRMLNWYTEKIATPAITKLTQAGCLVRVVTIAGNRRRGLSFLQWLKTQNFDAALSISVADWIGKSQQPIHLYDFPLVHVGVPDPRIAAHTVDKDPFFINRLILDHLQEVGYRSCGYIIALNYPSVLQRFNSFVAEAKKRGLWNSNLLLDLRSNSRHYAGSAVDLKDFSVLKKAIRSAKKPIALVTHNDFIAAALLEWLQTQRFQVPSEVGVVGCDNNPVYALGNIGLTTIHLPAEELGITCADVLLQALHNHNKGPSIRRVLQTTLVVRESTVHSTGSGKWLLDVIEGIKSDLTSKHLRKKLSNRTGWAYDTVGRRFKKAMGLSILQYRDQLRFDQAAELLRKEPNLKVEYVFRRFGFSSPTRFYNMFRKRYGASPGLFRLHH